MDIKSEADSEGSEIGEQTPDNPKPYLCTVCNKRFKYRGSLDIHARTHVKDKTHRCTTCNKEFVTEGRLLRHQATHASEARESTCLLYTSPSPRDS